MRLLVVHDTGAPDGAARVVAELAAALAARDHGVAVAAPPGAAVLAAVAPPVEAVTLPAGGGRLRRAWRLRRLVQAGFADAVLVATDAAHVDAVRAVRLAGRGTVVRRVPLGTPPAVARRAWRRGTAVAVFADERDLAAARVPPPVPPRVVPPGTSAAPPPLEREEPPAALAVVLPAGAPVGAGALLRAAALVAARHPVPIALCGSADATPPLLHAAALGVGPAAQPVPPGRWRAALHDATVALVAAVGDDAVLAALDALAAGVAVVVERDAPVARLLGDAPGVTAVAPNDVHGAAAAVAALLAVPERRRALARAARRHVAERWPWDAAVAAWDDALALAAGSAAVPAA